MRVLIACEFSGIVREEFQALGHDVCSIDLLPTEIPGRHVIADVRHQLSFKWDLMIGFPPCTAICNTGNRWYANTEAREEGIRFFRTLMECEIPRIALENPMGVISSRLRRPDQIIHPYFFGEPYSKRTGLWLKNLPYLEPTNMVPILAHHYVQNMGSGLEQWRERSRTPRGLARAMAHQWGVTYNDLNRKEPLI